MARYLFRIANTKQYSPVELLQVSEAVRKVLGSKESASHFRIGTKAFEFNLFALSSEEVEAKRGLLEGNGFRVISEKLLDTPTPPVDKKSALKEGVELFNEERFWESHEILEQAWRSSKGSEQDAIQGLIQTAAAFVHYQKNERDISLSIMKRARAKMYDQQVINSLGLADLRKGLDSIIMTGEIRLFKI